MYAQLYFYCNPRDFMVPKPFRFFSKSSLSILCFSLLPDFKEKSDKTKQKLMSKLKKEVPWSISSHFFPTLVWCDRDKISWKFDTLSQRLSEVTTGRFQLSSVCSCLRTWDSSGTLIIVFYSETFS